MFHGSFAVFLKFFNLTDPVNGAILNQAHVHVSLELRALFEAEKEVRNDEWESQKLECRGVRLQFEHGLCG